MHRLAALIALAFASTPLLAATPAELARWEARAKQVEILRDKWGIAHIFGKSDADAVFGMLYAQAEDDFARIETNYINAMGRLAEVEGEAELWRDLRMKLFIDPKALQAQYAASPAWLKKLMQGWADGLNYYLHTHPEVKPRLLTQFEPWMALSFSEGSIGGDIESVSLRQLEGLYTQRQLAELAQPALPEPAGSNGFAIAPRWNAHGHAMLMINPHTSFYFRPEIHVVSQEGLNAYGAVTWGQFFVYQGFNERLGWMHTSGGADVIDEYLETVVEKDGNTYYQYEGKLRPMKAVQLSLPFKTATGMASRTQTVWYTHHGPVVRAADGKWVSVRLMNNPLPALQQSWLRTKARDYRSFVQAMQLRTNSSNNTVYADRDGNIAYFHGNFVPRRDPRFDWSRPVDGSTRATEWQGLHKLDETIHLFNPASGWLFNTNNWPFTAAGTASPKQSDYPAYMAPSPENARGVHALRLLSQLKAPLSIDGMIALAYDSYLTAFDPLLPLLFAAADAQPGNPVAAQVALLRAWDRRSSLTSSATSLGIYWLQDLVNRHADAARLAGVPVLDYLPRLAPAELLAGLERASARLQTDFGSWQTPWGEINRFQRLSGEVQQRYDDNQPSLPVPMASGNWGALASFGMRAKQTTKRIYGDYGNSFVAVVEFGPRIQAKSLLAGGVSGNPASPHFNDQAQAYTEGRFKDVLFYREDIEKQLERKYRPGQ
ncbi:penicillin acylase family protein [Massilia sp. TS11]|uniref:penicillin acylase family protein n=1 Tax=Massilia sp. TS11 TaxID=2908003 RepID=UPI001EDAA80A|nr:penicillin acylase family protein [Massilia sp. TS11]MCG2584536.1 penicillin acylase family protein [Massilia sp. TS11]